MAESEEITLPQPLVAEGEVPEIAERIMLAAIELFGRKGYAATSVREIVQKAQVTNPMLYYYFDSKEGLFKRLMEFLFRHMQLAIAEIVADDGASFEEKLRAIVETHLEGVRESPEILRFVYSAIFGPRDSRPDLDIHAMHMRTHEMVEGMIAEALESGELTMARETFDPCQMAELLLGVINQDLMRALKLMERGVGEENGAHALPTLESLTGPEAVERIIIFFLGGIGSVERDEV